MHARVSFYELREASLEDAVRAFESARGALEQMQGSRGGMLLVNPHDRKAITITLWETDDALRATEQQANQVRQQATSSVNMTITGVEAYEVAMEFGG